jgi:hypothetical protein
MAGPSLLNPPAQQSDGLEQEMVVYDVVSWLGNVCGPQVSPPSVVASMRAVPCEVWPRAKHPEGLGHETAVRIPRAGWATQVFPPSSVETMPCVTLFATASQADVLTHEMVYRPPSPAGTDWASHRRPRSVVAMIRPPMVLSR